ncbi:Glycolate oxidase OS=Streptomyces microflavus OX=1919 GN=Smic_72880 PE=4 SV=1 [Streptomyces microflavus]
MPTYDERLRDKLDGIAATGAEVCTAGNSSCPMHIGGGLSRIRSGTRTLHLARILAATRTTPDALTEAAA